jgi:hypothetical protein
VLVAANSSMVDLVLLDMSSGLDNLWSGCVPVW